MKFKLQRRRVEDDNDHDWWHLESIVYVDDEALAALRSDDAERVRWPAEEKLFREAGAQPAHSSGPGRSFCHRPSWGGVKQAIDGHTVKVFQTGGMDI